MDIATLLNNEIVETLTDFKDNQIVFWRVFDENKKFGTPVKNVLELGVYRLPGQPNSDLPGQSTKTLMILEHFYGLDKFVSLDIDDCNSTINNCKRWVESRGVVVKNHKFVQCNSVHYDVLADFPNGVDLIFLDTNHDDNYPEKIGYANSGGAGMTYKEICHYAKHLTRNGRLFLHDTNHYYVPKQKGWNTSGAIELFIEENGAEFGFHEHNTNNHGLGEIYRLDSDVASLYK